MNIESIKVVIVIFGIIASSISWIACIEEISDFNKGTLYFAGITAASALLTYGVML